MKVSYEDEFVQGVMDVVKKHFPNDVYVLLAAGTKGVYERRSGVQENKYDERYFNLEMGLITCASANRSRNFIDETYTAVVEIGICDVLKEDRAWYNIHPYIQKVVIGVSIAMFVYLLSSLLGLK